ncbi:uncharacterized protein Aud_002630 [Aspergillus udagawae]|uniref:Uncharacterized protein n=1 Tax=Aspergillus udagawae TaxID=91492 RepID=A0A8E0UUF7_9EURO|nr:uncharacterized protein Aud_002630 [Aspergillus udagawae]GIC86262.1 hypothetical protein Aud_002630 [Aspergillus udagawae]
MVPAVSRLVEAVNFHPFGIALTASFLRLHAGQSVDDYYRELQQLKAKTSNHEGIPPEISIPLSIHLKSLENTPSGRLLTLFALIDADRITEKFLRVSQKAVPTSSRENRLSCFTSAEFQPAMTTLRSLSLLEKARDADGGYFKVPKCVGECVLHRLREDSANFQTAVETATAWLYSIIASNNINTVEALNIAVPLIGQHYISLSKHSCGRDLCPSQRFQYLGTLVSLYHLRKAASLGFMVCLKRSFRAWLLRNRELSGEDSIDPSLYDEIPPSIPHPNEKTSLWQGTEAKVAGPVSSVLWKNVEGLMIVSAISRAWFTIKEDMLAIARRSAGRYAGAKADDVEDRVDKAAHEAITGVVVGATNDYVRMAAEFGSGSGTMELPDLVARAVTYGLDDCADIRAFSEDDLVSIISDAISSDMFSLTWLAGCAWASVLERQKHRMAVVLESLVQQSTNLEALSDTARFTIEQLSKRGIQDYVGEIIEATWEAIDSARCWVAVIIRQGLGLAMMSRMAKSAEPYSHENFGSLRVLVYDSMELLAGAFSVISSEYPPNWEWAALMRSIAHHFRAAEQGTQLTDVAGITPEVKF